MSFWNKGEEGDTKQKNALNDLSLESRKYDLESFFPFARKRLGERWGRAKVQTAKVGRERIITVWNGAGSSEVWGSEVAEYCLWP